MNRVLVIDDERDILEALESILSRHGYQVAVASSGEEGIEKVQKERFDVALIDLGLPGIDGIDTLEHIRKTDSEIEAIIITGHASLESAINSMKRGAYDYVEKPINHNKLIAIIEKALQKHQLTETVALYEVSKAVFSTIDMDDLLNIIIGLFMKLMRGDDASIMLFDGKGGLSIAASNGLAENIKKDTRLAMGERIAGWVAENRQPLLLINGLKNDPRFQGIATREHIKSAIVVPLIKNDKVLGILSVNRITIEENFTKIELYKSSVFASLASLALDNARMYKELFTTQEKLMHTIKELEEKEGKAQSMLSDLKAAHEELKSSRQQLSQAEKLADLGRLISDMAHEVNNPLMIISGNAQLSLLEGTSIEEMKVNLKIIYEECNRAKGIIQRLLKYARPTKGERKEININQTIEFVIKIVEHQFSLSDVIIKKDLKVGFPPIFVDEEQIQEVLMNLLSNAREAMPDGGTIDIRTSLEQDFIRIEVKDSGMGMDEETLSRIFEPFFTTKENGTGLGLAVCQGIVKTHHGELKFASQPGKGTVATLLLPLRGEE